MKLLKKNRHIAIPIAAICLLIIISCSSVGAKRNYPDWYLKPPKNNSLYLYGVGEGYDLDTAVQSALKNLSSRLMVTISAKSELLKEENRYGYNVESKQQIEEVITGLTFNNYEVNETEIKNNKVFALVTIDRIQFIKDKKQRLESLESQMAELYNNSRSKSILEQRNDLQKIAVLAEEGTTLSYLLGGLENSFDTKKHIDKYIAYDSEYQKINNKMIIYLESRSSFNKMFAEVIQIALNKEEIKVTANNDISNSNLVKVIVNTDSSYEEIYGSNMAKVKVYITTMSNKGKIIGSNQIEVTGSSVIDNSHADRAVVKAFEDKVSEVGVMKIIGL